MADQTLRQALDALPTPNLNGNIIWAVKAAQQDGARLALELAIALCEQTERAHGKAFDRYRRPGDAFAQIGAQDCRTALHAQLKELDQ